MLNEKSAKVLEEKLKDKAFLESIFSAEEAKDVVKIINDEGIEITEEEVIEIRNELQRKITSEDELTEDELEGVSGGIIVTSLIAGIAGGIGLLASVSEFVHTKSRGRW